MEKLFVSFSGGKTSGYMTKQIIDNYSDRYEIVILFANTGQENEETLKFVDRCDKAWGLNVVWVEAIVNPISGKGTTHKIVDFETASRSGEPFEAMIKKYGIPNKAFPHCTRELKLRPMESYMRSIGWRDHYTAIGIRTDEIRRCSKSAAGARIVYPLIDWFETDKQDVNDWWEDQPFNLGIEEHHGNCSWCWKKSFRKHFMLIDEMPFIYDFPRRMEKENGLCGAGTHIGARVFFRQNMSTDDLFKLAEQTKSEESRQVFIDLDSNSGCSESCEVYMTYPDSQNLITATTT